MSQANEGLSILDLAVQEGVLPEPGTATYHRVPPRRLEAQQMAGQAEARLFQRVYDLEKRMIERAEHALQLHMEVRKLNAFQSDNTAALSELDTILNVLDVEQATFSGIIQDIKDISDEVDIMRTKFRKLCQRAGIDPNAL